MLALARFIIKDDIDQLRFVAVYYHEVVTAVSLCVVQCFDTVGWIIWLVKPSTK